VVNTEVSNTELDAVAMVAKMEVMRRIMNQFSGRSFFQTYLKFDEKSSDQVLKMDLLIAELKKITTLSSD
jgi:hypothetical protein